MCGIAGVVNRNQEPVSPVLLRRMTDAIAHRGPDGEGHYIDGAFGLGHRRLAIIDTSTAGHQPMVTADGRYVLSYNGEVYNYRELRVLLESLGYRFHSQTDSEVVLNAYAEWGEKCVDRFNGMFAFAIWDCVEKSLFLARDRYGVKPLYYFESEDIFLFASEQKGIICHPAAKRDIDVEGLVEYFTFQNFFTQKTLLQGICLFPAGHYAKITKNQRGELKKVCYWDFSFTEEGCQYGSENECMEELERLFQQAVSRQLVSDVEVGSYLSGGIDSGAITAVAAKQLPYLKTFTCGFDLHSVSGLELSFDERQKAEHMSYLFKTEHYEMVLKAGDMERILPQLAWHVEEPRVGQCYPNYYVAQLASKFVKVSLAGTGGDELFGGYPWRYYRAVVNEDFEQYVDKYYQFWQRLIPSEKSSRMFAPIWPKVKHVDTKAIFHNVFPKTRKGKLGPEEYVNSSLYFEAKTFLHGLLVLEDKISMAHKMETRVPFLDNDLVEFAMRLPVRYKLKNLHEVVKINENDVQKKWASDYSKTSDGKMILRKLTEKYIPQDINNAIKQGFSAPDASWFRGESIDYVKKIVENPRTRMYDFLSKKEVLQAVEQHISGKTNNRLFIWSLLNFEAWLNHYL